LFWKLRRAVTEYLTGVTRQLARIPLAADPMQDRESAKRFGLIASCLIEARDARLKFVQSAVSEALLFCMLRA
jgi:hypothetical protein